jgi:hypothetical protein
MTATAGNRWVTVNFQMEWPKDSPALSISSCTLMCPLRFLAIRGCRICSGNNVPDRLGMPAGMEEKENVLRLHRRQIRSPIPFVAWASAHLPPSAMRASARIAGRRFDPNPLRQRGLVVVKAATFNPH